MTNKPTTAAGYAGGTRDLVRATCLYVATKLGDLMDDLVVVGGLVPSLLVDQVELPPGADAHVGTMDLDIGLALGLLDEQRYTALTERLHRAGFEPDTNEQGRMTRQRWRLEGQVPVTVDFLIAPSMPDDRPGRLRNIEEDFAAVIVPGLTLAFRDRRRITLSGITVLGEQATRDVWVCGPGAFIVLKAHAFANRGENKDAYDLYYVIRNYGAGPQDIATALSPLLDAQESREAIELLRRDFSDFDGTGPRRVAAFLYGSPDDEVQADVTGLIGEVVRLVDGQPANGADTDLMSQ